MIYIVNIHHVFFTLHGQHNLWLRSKKLKLRKISVTIFYPAKITLWVTPHKILQNWNLVTVFLYFDTVLLLARIYKGRIDSTLAKIAKLRGFWSTYMYSIIRGINFHISFLYSGGRERVWRDKRWLLRCLRQQNRRNHVLLQFRLQPYRWRENLYR